MPITPSGFSKLKSALVASWLLLAAIAPAARTHAADQPQPGPEQKKLEVWLGEWTYEGEGKESPFGPAGKFAGKQKSVMILNGFFLETRWQDRSDTGYIASGMDLDGYDEALKCYVGHGFENEGSVSTGTQTVNGNTWSGTSSRSDGKGKSYKLRFIRTLANDGRSCMSKADYSADDGKTWMPYWELKATKVGK